MMEDYTKVSEERWKQAQRWEEEVWLNLPKEDEDWNSWWFEKFNNYEILQNREFNSVLEVGCGPYAKNTEFFLSKFPNIEKVALLEPLLDTFINNNYSVVRIIKEHRAETFNTSLEEAKIDSTYDVIICINVLDHVKDANLCMENMKKLLNPKGVLILGQDLTNEEDLINCPATKTDIGHPIKLDHEYFKVKLQGFTHLYQRILTRQEGRNPVAHYGTLIYVGEKA